MLLKTKQKDEANCETPVKIIVEGVADIHFVQDYKDPQASSIRDALRHELLTMVVYFLKNTI